MITSERWSELNILTVDRRNMFYWQVDRPMTMLEFSEIFMGRHDSFDKERSMHIINEWLANVAGYENTRVAEIITNPELEKGSVNVNRYVVLSDGRELVLRLHPAGLKNAYFDVEALAMNTARSVVPTPKIVGVLHDEPAYDFIVMEKMSGRNMYVYLQEHPEQDEQLVRATGRTMAKLHSVKVSGFGFFDNERAKAGELVGLHGSFRDHLLASLPENLSVVVDGGYLTKQQADAVEALLTQSELVHCEDPRLLHNDLADWNVLVDGENLTAVLDWDECFAGDPVADIACWSLFFSQKRLKMFLEGYAEVTPLGHNFEEKLHLYRLRYIAAKMSLRHRKFEYQKDDIMEHLLDAGKQAIDEEMAYLDL